MALPWMFALRVIPWKTLLARAPQIAKAADALLSGRAEDTVPRAALKDLRALEDRVATLERARQADAELLALLSRQVDGLTSVVEVLAARLRWLLVGTVVALALALSALIVVIAHR